MALKIAVQRLHQFFQLATDQPQFDNAGLVRLRSLLLVGESGIGLHRDSYESAQSMKNVWLSRTSKANLRQLASLLNTSTSTYVQFIKFVVMKIYTDEG